MLKYLMAAVLAVSPASNVEERCLAQVVHHEARGESIAGAESVAHVVMNRVRNGRFGRGICGVAFAPSQFSRISRSIRPDRRSFEVARRVLSGNARNLIGSRVYFNGSGPNRSIRIGRHRFW